MIPACCFAPPPPVQSAAFCETLAAASSIAAFTTLLKAAPGLVVVGRAVVGLSVSTDAVVQAKLLGLLGGVLNLVGGVVGGLVEVVGQGTGERPDEVVAPVLAQPDLADPDLEQIARPGALDDRGVSRR